MNLAEIKDFFQGELPEFSRTEMSLMVKLLVLKTLDISDTEPIHFEVDPIDDPDLESHYFEACGMTDI